MAPKQSGFTLIEALIAMAIFAIASMMLLPSLFAWIQANTVSLQRGQAGSILDRSASHLRQQGWDTTEWNNTVATTSDLNHAVGTTLDDPTYTDWQSFDPSQGPFDSSVTVEYAVVEIQNDVGQPVARVMKLRAWWTPPWEGDCPTDFNDCLRETRIIQRNDAP